MSGRNDSAVLVLDRFLKAREEERLDPLRKLVGALKTDVRNLEVALAGVAPRKAARRRSSNAKPRRVRARKATAAQPGGRLANIIVTRLKGKGEFSRAQAMQAAKAGGYKPQGSDENFLTYVGIVLSKDSRVKRIRRGRYLIA